MSKRVREQERLPGSDAYDVSFENGTASASISLESDGRIGDARIEWK